MQGSPPFHARSIAGLRRTEIEVHHADLKIGYTAHHWPEDFTSHLIHRRQRQLSEQGQQFVLEIADLGGTLHVGARWRAHGSAARPQTSPGGSSAADTATS